MLSKTARRPIVSKSGVMCPQALAALFLLFGLAGCAPPTPKAPLQPPMEVDLRPVDKEALDRVIFDNTGRVILVNYWATWDDASMRQLSHMKVLQEVYAQDGFQLVLVSLDNNAVSESVVQFLQALRATGSIHLISEFGTGPESFEQFKVPSEAVPHFVLYDRMGNRVKEYSGLVVGIEEKIEELLKQTKFDKVVPDLESN